MGYKTWERWRNQITDAFIKQPIEGWVKPTSLRVEGLSIDL